MELKNQVSLCLGKKKITEENIIHVREDSKIRKKKTQVHWMTYPFSHEKSFPKL